MKPKYIVFCGVDGAGKTSIINRLRRELDATFIKEPTVKFKDTPVFKKVQLFAQDRAEQLEKIKFPLNKPLISDRSYICSLAYQSLEIEEECKWSSYQSINYVMEQQLKIVKPDLVVYIHCNPSIVHSRLFSRGEPLSIDEIKAIQERYHFIFKLYNFTILYVDTSKQSMKASVDSVLKRCK